ncbi:rubredoxin domain-containing protein [Telluribacter sp. SYSU D00476]|uniref:rubredoxin domain-containing protein n=1 Tax=Telluribacter sp. SYSU D00476 TaxID=2811430 RepID=UPI001FF2607C|nr:rubredoxin domain-containing protein [Telluribacter sp. SYSU D00476]
MRDYYNVKINIPGGIVSPGTLHDILSLAYEAKVRKVRFGARQQLLMTVHYEDMRFLEQDLKKKQISYELNTERYPNIISSYCAEEVFRTGQWLSESEYHMVLDGFDYQPQLKINLSDSNQSFTPFFTGNLNFIASAVPHFWYLYVRPKQSNSVFRWRELIYTNDIARLARSVEEAMLSEGHRDEESLYQSVTGQRKFITQPATGEVELPDFTLPYYEGFNRYGQRTWLGLYRRDEQFSISFLLDVCTLCLKTRIGEICITPWKSLIIKGIEEKNRTQWSQVLGRNNINVRHAANELAWQTEDHNEEGAQLKNYIVRFFDKHDTRTFGLCFGIQTRPKSEVFGSVLVRKRPLFQIGQLSLFSVYDIYFTDNFNPNSRTYYLFEKGLLKIHVPAQLERLCRKFSARRYMSNLEVVRFNEEEAAAPVSSPAIYGHQCSHCLTIYDERYGDVLNEVPAGVPFEQLPDRYTCPTCDAAKADMQLVELSSEVEEIG